jgi:hypothetical protein
MKGLLVNCINFQVTPQQILESESKNNGKLVVSGVLQRADAKNQNGRVYPKTILEREVKKYFEDCVKNRRALGELDHPDSSVVNLNNVSHNIVDMKWQGNDLVGTVEILTTPSGNILKELFRNGITLGISSRGLGSVKQLDERTVEVQDDFELIAFDFVSNPSTHGAFLSPVNESKNSSMQLDKYFTVNKLITDILSDKI